MLEIKGMVTEMKSSFNCLTSRLNTAEKMIRKLEDK